uniref:EGF-like domain-containing protein n=1 Tax=Parastrongyloides trichosuri TaxID=131310 RepID=A0A0N5A6R3_PARTI
MDLLLLFATFYAFELVITLDTTNYGKVLSPSEEFDLAIIKLKNISTISLKKFETYPVKSINHKLKKYSHSPKCTKTFRNKFFVLNNGVLRYITKNKRYNCNYKCSYPHDELRLQLGDWFHIEGAKPNCDVFEVKCHDKILNKVVFKDMFTHIVKIKNKPIEDVTLFKNKYPVKQLRNKYNVHVIVLDSTSYFNILHDFKETIKYLKNEYSAVPFKYNNKIGDTSKSNGYAFLLNTNKVGGHNYKSKKENKCRERLDNFPYIGKYYRQLNYTVLNNVDSLETVFTESKCTGLRNQFHHHTLAPYTIRMQTNKYGEFKTFKNHQRSKCRKNVEFQLNHLIEFMKVYEDSNQFSLTWLTKLFKNEGTGFFDYDEYFKDFFKKNKKMFDKSFLVFMSDRGRRSGAFKSVELNDFEASNPFLVIAPPKDLRRNNSEVLQNLKLNSDKHTSHFDTYATLIDIVTEGSKSNYKNMKPFYLTNIMKYEKIKGISLLRKIEGERSCRDMGIKFEDCLYREKLIKYNSSIINQINTDKNISLLDDTIVNVLRRNFVNELNDQLKLGGIEKHCASMSQNFEKELDVKYTYTDDNKIIFHLKINVLPMGTFEAYFNEAGELSSSIERIDKNDKGCLSNHKYKKFCYCTKRKNGLSQWKSAI